MKVVFGFIFNAKSVSIVLFILVLMIQRVIVPLNDIIKILNKQK